MFRLGRLAAVLLVLALIMTGAACRGDDDDPSSTDDVVMSTFTPRSATEAPTAASTDVAASPTLAVATPSGPREPTATAGPNEIRPPELVLVTPAGQSVGIVAANAWFDPETETFSGFNPQGVVTLAIDPLVWAQETQAGFEARDSPFPAGATDIAIFSYEENTAIPQDTQGQVVGSDLAFVKRTDPTLELTLQGPSLTLSTPVPNGKYIVDVTVHWMLPPDAAQQLPEEAMTQYVFVVMIP